MSSTKRLKIWESCSSSGKTKASMRAVSIVGSVVIPMGEYKSIRKQKDVFLAECYDGNIITGEIKK